MANVNKRNLFAELTEAIEDIKLYKKGKITLKQYEVKEPAKLEVSTVVIRKTPSDGFMRPERFSRIAIKKLKRYRKTGPYMVY